jgi:hypothetical protein
MIVHEKDPSSPPLVKIQMKYYAYAYLVKSIRRKYAHLKDNYSLVLHHMNHFHIIFQKTMMRLLKNIL